ncbi:MAG TPA: hypothetical protein DF613_13970, partial [Lachnospiraceae bacterium]|nr:hypothetical protein [Lachnospiraceae bacterium]
NNRRKEHEEKVCGRNFDGGYGGQRRGRLRMRGLVGSGIERFGNIRRAGDIRYVRIVRGAGRPDLRCV